MGRSASFRNPQSIHEVSSEESPFAVELLNHREPAVARQIHAIQMEAYRHEADLLQATDFPPLKRTTAEVQNSAAQYFGARCDSVLVGTLSVEPNESHRWQLISSLVVVPQMHRCGIGHALLEFVLNRFSSDPIRVSTAATNDAATSLYAKFGFIEKNRWIIDGLELVELERPASPNPVAE